MIDEALDVVEPDRKWRRAEKKILSYEERKAGFRIIRQYLDEESTPVPEQCFVRRGFIIQRAIDMSTKHNYIQTQLVSLIAKHLVSKDVKDAAKRIFIGNRINMSKYSAAKKRDETMPDIAVFSEPISGDMGVLPQDKIPILVIEILSESTASIDIFSKRVKYRERGVKHYWILYKSEDPSEGLEKSQFLKLQGRKYIDITARVQETGVLMCSELYDLKIDASDIWFSDDEKHYSVRWQKLEAQAEQEKQRADLLEQELKKLKKQ